MPSLPFVLPGDSDLSGIGIYNALDTSYGGGMIPNDSTKASWNENALQQAIDAAIAGGGGTVLIPTGDYYIQGPVYINTLDSPPGVPISVTVIGTSGKTTLEVPHNTDLFSVSAGLDDNGAGIVLQDLHIAYDDNGNGATAITVNQGRNVNLFRVVITEANQGVIFGEVAQCSLLECTISYNKDGPSGGTAVTIGQGGLAQDVHVAACTLFSEDPGSPPQPKGGLGLSVLSASRLVVANTRIEGFEQGVVINPAEASVQSVYFSNLNIYTVSTEPTIGAAVSITPESSSTVSEVVFVGCDIGPGESTGTLYEGAGIHIDQGSGSVDQVRFVSCYSCAWLGPGLQIDAATNVEVVGGYYSCNGIQTESLPSPLQAGIAIAINGNSVSGVRIVGTGCNNSVYRVGTGKGWLEATQKYGIALGAAASNVVVRDCDLTGNEAAALSIVTGAGVQVTDCAGYNDQATPLPSPSLGTSFSAETLGYYGPMSFYVLSIALTSTVKIDDQTTGLKQGAFTLSPGESAEISGGPVTIVAIGQ